MVDLQRLRDAEGELVTVRLGGVRMITRDNSHDASIAFSFVNN